MKKGFFTTSLIINTKRYYKTDELFELLKDKFGDKYGPISINKELKLLETIFIEGVDGWVNIVSSEWGFGGKGRIEVGIGEPIKKAFKGLKITKKDIIFIIFCVLTFGLLLLITKIIDFFRMFFHLEGTKKNRTFMKVIALEIEKIVKE